MWCTDCREPALRTTAAIVDFLVNIAKSDGSVCSLK